VKHETFMRIAELISLESKAKRLQVGAVAVIDDRIVATGFNGTPPGYDNNCEDENGFTKKEVIHAEVNTVAFASKHGVKLSGASVYCNHACCVPCAAVLGSAGISRFYYRSDYRDPAGLRLLTDLGIHVEQIK